MKKQLLLFFVALWGLIGSSSAADFTYNGLNYNVSSGYARVVATTISGNVIIPDQAYNSNSGAWLTVKYIDSYAFQNCSGITSVTIPSTVTWIGNYAFKNCSSLTTVNYNATNCTEFGSSSSGQNFSGCSNLRNLNIGGNVTTIPQNAFYGCSYLEDVTIPNSVTSIGQDAFRQCSRMASVTIGDHVTSIGSSAFRDCVALSSVTFIDNSQLTSIGNCAFYSCSRLSSITIPNTVTTIDAHAFNGCSTLASLTIPESVTSIGYRSFMNCTGLRNLTYNARTCNTIGSSEYPAFDGCTNINTLTIGENVSTINSYAFKGCSGLTKVIYNARNCSTMGTSQNPVFTGCTNIASIIIGENVSSIPVYAFKGCSGLTSVTFNAQNCTTMCSSSSPAFNGCNSLTSLKIGENVSTIPDYAFSGCYYLTKVTIPSSVTTIGDYAFYGCNNISKVLNLSSLSCTSGSTECGMVARYATVAPTRYGTGANTLYYIPGDITDYNATESIIPSNNYIYSTDNGNTWKAKNIVLTDDTCRFNTPVAFTAELAEYTRTLTDGNRSTLCLPFTTTTIPANLEVYTFTGYSISNSNGTLYFNTLGDNTISAYTPYLIGKGLTKDQSTFTFTQANASFPQTSAATPAYETTQNGMTFQGVMKRTCMNNTCYGYKDGFFVQSSQGSNNNSVHTEHAHVNPFRCYFTTGTPVGMTLDVVTDGDNLGIEEVDEDAAVETSIRYSTDVYDMMGRMVRKNAETLRGLPKGIYIWKGKKVLAF